jgi:mRNA interferase YafQ
MKTVIWEEGFRRSLKRLIKKQPSLQPKVLTVLEALAEDPFDPSLKTHKLKGDLKG